jgi:hypothetical protein
MHALQQAIYVPDGLKPSDIVPKLASRGVTIAAGLHKDIKEKYVRIGTMGVTVVDAQRGDVDRGALLPLSRAHELILCAVIQALRESFKEAGHPQ